jgi:Cdc6-like AAA superfamily ATPase
MFYCEMILFFFLFPLFRDSASVKDVRVSTLHVQTAFPVLHLAPDWAFEHRNPYAPKPSKKESGLAGSTQAGNSSLRGYWLFYKNDNSLGRIYSLSLTGVRGIMKSGTIIVLVPLPAFPRHRGKADEGMGRIGTYHNYSTPTPVEPDISRHVYICGETGVGKTTLLHNLMVQDIHDGKGFAFFDSHGDETENLIPQHCSNSHFDLYRHNILRFHGK